MLARARVRNEVEIAQLRPVGEHEAIEAGQQRGVVERGTLEVMFAGTRSGRSAGMKLAFGPAHVERRERRVLERGRRNRRNLAPTLGQALRVEAVRRGEARVGLVALDLIGERRAREFVEAPLVATFAAARPVRDGGEKRCVQFRAAFIVRARGALRRELMSPEL